MCIPNDDRTQLLEFCYIYPRILITKGNEDPVTLSHFFYIIIHNNSVTVIERQLDTHAFQYFEIFTNVF